MVLKVFSDEDDLKHFRNQIHLHLTKEFTVAPKNKKNKELGSIPVHTSEITDKKHL